MKKYEQPAIELIKFNANDVILASGEPTSNTDWDTGLFPVSPGSGYGF